MSKHNLPLAVSLGDPSGIGPDILLKAWTERQEHSLPEFLVVGDLDFLQKRAKELQLDCNFASYNQNTGSGQTIPVLDTGFQSTGAPGKPDTADAEGTIEAIKTSVQCAMEGMTSGVVTLPINKAVLYDAGFSHPGHTEFLAELAKQHTAKAVTPVMMLAGPELRTVPVTIHIPLYEVPAQLTTELIVETASIAANDLKHRFGIKAPRLAIAGLNPHAGENGAMGHEDEQIIKPAIKQLQSMNIDAKGPLPADTMFHKAARKTYDVAICMYHDQALIPAKTLGFDDAVNVTLGLPFIRTSPDHGTAYDIAGTGKANPASFIAALKLAEQMSMTQ